MEMEPVDLTIHDITFCLRRDPTTPGGAYATIESPRWTKMTEARTLTELMDVIHVVVGDVDIGGPHATIFFDAAALDEDKHQALEEALERLAAPPTTDE